MFIPCRSTSLLTTLSDSPPFRLNRHFIRHIIPHSRRNSSIPRRARFVQTYQVNFPQWDHGHRPPTLMLPEAIQALRCHRTQLGTSLLFSRHQCNTTRLTDQERVPILGRVGISLVCPNLNTSIHMKTPRELRSIMVNNHNHIISTRLGHLL